MRAPRQTTARTRPTRPAVLATMLAVLTVPSFAPADDVVARVNGAEILRRQVHDVVTSVMVDEQVPPTSEEIARLTRAAIESLIELELLYQEATARDLGVGSAAVDAEIQKTRAGFQTEEEFRDALARSGMTEAGLREDTRRTLLADRLLEEVAWKDIDVSSAEIRAFYDEHPEEFSRPAQVRIRRILVEVSDDAPLAERSAAWRKAGDLRDRLVAGANFASLAREHSSDAASARRGGDLGFVGRGTLPAQADSAAFRLGNGELSEVLETDAGYEILQVTERRPGREIPFEAAEENIRQALLEAERQERRQLLVDELRKKANIELLPDGRDADENRPATD